MKKIISVVLVLGLVLSSLAACGSSKDDSSKGDKTASKVGLILSGKKDDGGWNQVGYLGVDGFIKKNSDIELVVKEEVPDGNAIQPMNDLILNEKCDIIVTHGAEYLADVTEVAKDNENVQFFITSSSVINDANMSKAGNNISGIIINGVDQGYLQGIAAGTLTKSKKLGATGGIKLPAFVDTIAGFKVGAQSIDSSITIEENYTQSMSDVSKVKDQSLAYYDKGIDVAMATANQSTKGVVEASEAKGAGYWSISTMAGDLSKPTLALVAKADLVPAITDALGNYVKDPNGFKQGDFIYGVKNNTADVEYISIEFNKNVDQKVKDAVQKAIDDIKSGDLITTDKVSK